ncbi:MAG: tetratricopeptide repeat protein [Calditrichota bacterium]
MKLNNYKTFVIILIMSISVLVHTGLSKEVKIVKMSGEVKIRHGVDELWQPASLGIFLKDIDSILTGEKGEVILQVEEGRQFNLGPNSMLDIADLREISEQELFLYLMKSKLGKVEKRNGKTPLRIGNVSVVHGTYQDTAKQELLQPSKESEEQLKNGIRALYTQQYYPNTILKINKTIEDQNIPDQWGELHYYLGSSFEKLDKPGQAIDAFEKAVQESKSGNCTGSEWSDKAENSLLRLKQ